MQRSQSATKTRWWSVCRYTCLCARSGFIACMWNRDTATAAGPVFYLVAASLHLRRRAPLCHSGWHMEKQPLARGVQKGSPSCQCLSLWLCPLSCPDAGRLRKRGGGHQGTVIDWQVTGEARATEIQTLIHNPVWFNMFDYVLAYTTQLEPA